MKQGLFIIAFIFSLHVNTRAQLMPSTVREVYDFAVGDTFEYSGGYSFNYPINPRYDIHRFEIIEDKRVSLGNDTLYYTYRIKEQRNPWGPPGISYSETIELRAYTNLDSFIIDTPQNDTCYFSDLLYCEQDDSVYIDTVKFIGRKINTTYSGVRSWGYSFSEFCEGLGAVYFGEFSEDPWWPQGYSDLIYYHKANGEQWGTPYYFTIVGIEEKQTINASVYPNPANEHVEISIPSVALSKHTSVQFQLFDIAGKAIQTQTIVSEKTLFTTAHLPKGIYYWRMASANQTLQQGKLVKQ